MPMTRDCVEDAFWYRDNLARREINEHPFACRMSYLAAFRVGKNEIAVGHDLPHAAREREYGYRFAPFWKARHAHL